MNNFRMNFNQSSNRHRSPLNGSSFFRAKNLAIFAGSLSLIFATLFSTLIKMPVAQAAGTISGRVFQDYNSNGAYNTAGDTANPAVDAGISGVTVTAYDPAGVSQGSTTSGAGGIYSLSATGTGPYRVEFTTLPSGYQPSARSTDSVLGGTATNAGSTVQFVNNGNTSNVNLAVSLPDDYCQNNPLVCNAMYLVGNVDGAALHTFPYNYASELDGNINGTWTTSPSRDATLAPSSIGTNANIGATYGVAWDKFNNRLFASAYVKRGARQGGLSGESTGAIFVKNTPSSASPAPTVYVDLNTVFGAGTTGANPHPVATTDWTSAESDPNTTQHVAKRGLGDLEISRNGANLYTVNLTDRRLYVIPTTGTLNSTTITRFSVPTTGLATSNGTCNAADVRPFGLGRDGSGNIYVGAVCSAESETADTKLHAYVWRFDNPGFTLVLNRSLSNFTRFIGSGAESAVSWQRWSNTVSTISEPSPMLGDIDFDGTAMILGIRDRYGDQVVFPNFYRGYGDIMRACLVSGSYTFETNGSCGGTTTSGANTTSGPGGGEYYVDLNGDGRDEGLMGSLLQIAGHNSVMSTGYDPVAFNSSGTRVSNFYTAGVQKYNNTTGVMTGAYDAYLEADPDNFGKANGIGDIEALCDLAPVEIGNRVWNDTNGNGVQDAGENGINNVALQLYQGGSPVTSSATPYQDGFAAIAYDGSTGSTNWSSSAWTEISDDNVVTTGNVRVSLDGAFSNALRLNQASTGASRSINLSGATSATLRFDYRRNASQGATAEYTVNGTTWVNLATYAAGTDAAYLSSGLLTLPVTATAIRFMNGAANGNNQRVFIDNVEISTSTNAVTTTDTNGEYYFTGVQPNTAYEIRVASAQSALTGLNLTSVNSAFQNGAVDSNDSDAVTSGSNYVINHTTGSAGTNNHTLDIGFSATGTYSLGNRVWIDTDNNGQINGAEVGQNGVSVSVFADATCDGVIDTPSTAVATQSTSGGGFYRFDTLAAGNYIVRTNPVNFQTGGALVGRASSIPTVTNPNTDTDLDDNGYSTGSLVTVGVQSGCLVLGAGASEPVGESNLGTGDSSQVDNRTNLTVDFGFYTPSSPTLAKVSEFSAFTTEKGVVVEWQSSYEIDNLGYRVWRVQGTERTPLSKELVAGSIMQVGQGVALPAGGKYYSVDRETNQNNFQDVSYWLEDIDLAGTSTWHGPISTGGHKTADFRESLTLDQLPNVDSAKQTESAVAVKTVRAKAKPVTGNKTANSTANPFEISVKDATTLQIEVAQDGWVRVSREQLGTFADNVNPATWQMFVAETEIPIAVNADGSMEFEARAGQNRATDGQVYTLVKDRGFGKRLIVERTDFDDSAQPTWFMQQVEKRDRMVRISSILNGAAENFYGASVGSWVGYKTLDLNKIATESGATANVRVNFQGLTQTSLHNVQVSLNNVVLGTVTFNGRERAEFSMDVPLSQLQEGSNTVSYTELATGSYSLVENINITFPRRTEVFKNRLTMRQEAGQAMQVRGLTIKAPRVLDITDEKNPIWLSPEVSVREDETYTFTLPQKATGRTIRIESADEFITAREVRINTVSTLQSPKNRADFLIIAPRTYQAATEGLRLRRESEGLRTRFVDVQDIYDEFNFGVKSPEAIKAFLQRASTVWNLRPRYVLFVGHASVDPKNYTTMGGAQLDQVPTMLFDSAYMETSSDEMLADFNNDGISDLAVGRIPATSAAEAQMVLTRSLQAENASQNWSNRKAVLVQDFDGVLDFATVTANINAALPSGMNREIIRKTDGDAATVRDRIVSNFNSGALLVNYFGHGSNTSWTNSNILRTQDTTTMTNGGNAPIVIAMTCLNGTHAENGFVSLAEALLKAANGGARGVFASSTLVNANGQEAMSNALYPILFANGTAQSVRIGDALRQAKTATADRDIRLSYSYFGDPTSPFVKAAQ